MRSPRALLVTAITCWCVSVAIALAVSTALTGDEAAYALMAHGVHTTWIYRPIGFVTWARIGAAFGGSDLAQRLPCALVSPLLLVGIAALGRRFSPWTAAAAPAVIASTHTFVLRAPELLDDIPATTCIVWALVIAIGELEREGGPRYRLVAVAPLLAAAFYVRYGTAPAIALAAVAALALWRRQIRARPGPVLATALVLAALLAPFAIYSLRVTGSPGGVLAAASEAAGRTFVGQGLRSYLGDNPFRLYGIVITPVLALGIASVAWPPVRERRAARLCAALAVLQVIALGLVSHGSTRFVFLPMALLTVLGVDLLERTLRDERVRRAIAWVLAATCIAMTVAVAPLEHRIARELAPMVAAARAIRADAGGRACTVIARATPQVMWYSGCASYRISSASAAVSLDPGRAWYAASTPRRPIDPVGLAAASQVRVIPLGVPGAWRLAP